MDMNFEQAVAQLKTHLELHFHIGVDDVEITESKGYWQFKKPCDASCHHQIHGFMGNGGRIQHTIYFAPQRREKGKIVSPYEVWNIIKTGN